MLSCEYCIIFNIIYYVSWIDIDIRVIPFTTTKLRSELLCWFMSEDVVTINMMAIVQKAFRHKIHKIRVLVLCDGQIAEPTRSPYSGVSIWFQFGSICRPVTTQKFQFPYFVNQTYHPKQHLRTAILVFCKRWICSSEIDEHIWMIDDGRFCRVYSISLSRYQSTPFMNP